MYSLKNLPRFFLVGRCELSASKRKRVIISAGNRADRFEISHLFPSHIMSTLDSEVLKQES